MQKMGEINTANGYEQTIKRKSEEEKNVNRFVVERKCMKITRLLLCHVRCGSTCGVWQHGLRAKRKHGSGYIVKAIIKRYVDSNRVFPHIFSANSDGGGTSTAHLLATLCLNQLPSLINFHSVALSCVNHVCTLLAAFAFTQQCHPLAHIRTVHVCSSHVYPRNYF